MNTYICRKRYNKTMYKKNTYQLPNSVVYVEDSEQVNRMDTKGTLTVSVMCHITKNLKQI